MSGAPRRARPSRTRSAVVTAVAFGLGLAAPGCVSKNEIGGSNNPTPTTTSVPPEFVALGADVTYGGVMATVIDITSFDQSPNGTPRVRVVMRVENLSDAAQRNPDVQLICDETTNTGDWFLGSTWEPNVVLPVNAVSQGEVIVGFPLKGDSPEYPVVTCSSAKVRVTLVDARSTGPKVVDVPVDDTVIADAIRRPRGPSLPLPPRGS